MPACNVVNNLEFVEPEVCCASRVIHSDSVAGFSRSCSFQRYQIQLEVLPKVEHEAHL